MESSLWSAHPDMKPRLHPLLKSGDVCFMYLSLVGPAPVPSVKSDPSSSTEWTQNSSICCVHCQLVNTFAKGNNTEGKNGRVLCSIKPTSPGPKSSSPCNSDNPVAGEESQPMEVAALHIFSYFYLIRPVLFFSYQPPVMPSRFSTVENLNRVNAASRSDVDLREGKPLPKLESVFVF